MPSKGDPCVWAASPRGSFSVEAPPIAVQVLCVSHPLKWDGHGGQYDGPRVVAELQRALWGNGVEVRGISRTARGNRERSVTGASSAPSGVVQDVTEFIGRIGRRLAERPRHNGFDLWLPRGDRGDKFGYVRLNRNNTFTVYSYPPFSDPQTRFGAQPSSGGRDCRYTFDQKDPEAVEYSLGVLRSAYDSR